MQNGWTTTKLGDHIQTLKGYAFKSYWYSDSGVPLVKVSDFTNDAIDTTKLMRVPDEIAGKYSKYELKTDDVVIQTVGSWPTNPQSVVGKVIRVPRKANRSLLNQNAVKIIPDESIDKKFLFYALRSSSFKNYIIGCAQGAASQASITLDAIRNYDLSFPKLEHQSRIAAILSFYDDLIENNTRRIQILEEMARMIYEEWFVRFRFPGHENVGMIKSDFGLIPLGWGIEKLSSVVELKSGYAFKTSEFDESGEYGLVTIKNVQDGAFIQEFSNRIGELPIRMPAYCHLSDGDILLSLTGNVGRVCVVYGNKLVLNQRVSKLAPKQSHHRAFLYCLFRSLSFRTRLENLANGVAQQNLSPVRTAELLIVIPNSEVLEQFENTVGSILDSIVNINLRNANLRRTRDLLLPKLISGEIDVSNFPNPSVNYASTALTR